jgi:hypothetical protein
MKLSALDFSVAIFAGVSCLLMLIGVPVWAVFIGWAWYFTLGAKPVLIRQGILPILAGSVLAVVAFLLIPLFAKVGFLATPLSVVSGFSVNGATILAVIITVFLLMLTLKIKVLNISLISFNAYSCIFVGYAAGTYMPVGNMPALLNAIIWIAGANFIGLLFGWLSIKFSGNKS